MRKKWLAMLLALTMAVSPATVQMVDASTTDIEAGVTATSPYVDTTADPTESYEYTITGDDGSVAVVEVPAILDKVYTKYTPDFTDTATQPVENGTYVIVGAHTGTTNGNSAYGNVITRNTDGTLGYTDVETNLTDGSEAIIEMALNDSEWEFTYQATTDGISTYTIAVETDTDTTYLNVGSSATTSTTSAPLNVINNTKANYAGNVAIGTGATTEYTYLNFNEGSNVVEVWEADAGSAWYLYSLAYVVNEEAVEAATADVGAEGAYTTESWADYEAALEGTDGIFETEDEAVAAYNALVTAVANLTSIELPDGITATAVDAHYELVNISSGDSIEAGTYLLLNSRYHRALLAETDESTTKKYLQVLTQPSDYENETPPEEIKLTEAQAAYSLDWEISNENGTYYIKNVSTQGYLQITAGKGNVSATLTEDNKVATTISSYSGSEAHSESVVIGQGGQYLNMHGGSGGNFGGYDQAYDGGSATYLYKKILASTEYTVDISSLQTLVDTYEAENLQETIYTTASWTAYENALAAAEELLAGEHSFAALDEAVAHQEEIDAAYEALENAKNALTITYSMETLYETICEANGGDFLFSEMVYGSESAQGYLDALKAARGEFATVEEAVAALDNLKAAVEALKNDTIAEACFPEMNWKVTEEADSTETTWGKNYIQNLSYINTSAITENEITFEKDEALTWTWSNIERLVNDEDEKVSPVWSQSPANGMYCREFSSAASNETYTQADVYKISGEFVWPEDYDLHDTTIVLDSKNDFFYRDIYDYINENGLGDYFPLGQVLPVNDDVYVVVWAGDTAPTLPVEATDTTEGDDGINNYLAFWAGTSGKGIWTQNGMAQNDWAREEAATFLEWNLQGERTFRKSYPNTIGTGAVAEDGTELTNADVQSYNSKYLVHTDGWYTLVDTTSINSVMRANYPDDIAAGTTVHIDLYVMNNSTNGVIDELEIELIKEKETETEVIVNYYLNGVSDDTFLGSETLLNQAYGSGITLLPGTGAGQLNSYKAEAIYQAGYKDVTDGVQQGTVPYIVTEGIDNVINVVYTVEGAKIIQLTADTDSFTYDGSTHTLSNVTVTENGQEATALGNGQYTLPDGNTLQNVYSYVSKADPGIYENNFVTSDGDTPTYVVVDADDNEVTNTYTFIKTPGTLTITYDPESVTRIYDFGVENIYQDVLQDIELKAAFGETADNVVADNTTTDISYTPVAANTGEKIELDLIFAGGYTVTKELNFLPATNVLYEDNFAVTTEDSGWTVVAPHAREVDDNDDTVYGYSAAYDNDFAFSNGTAMVAELTLDGANAVETYGAATFNFTGTGFDLISECGTNTGMLLVKITNATETGSAKFCLVDTYFTGDEELITGANILDYQVPVIREMELPYGEHEVSVWGYLVSTTGAGAATYGMSRMSVSTDDIIMAALEYAGLSEEADVSEVEVSFIDENSTLNGGTGNAAGYGVSTFALTDETETTDTETSSNTAYVYIDGFRVYGALEDETHYSENEKGLKYASVYDFAQNSAGDMADEEEGIIYSEDSLVYVEYDGNVGIASIAQYKNQGPQNEVYLGEYSAIGFTLENYDAGMTVMISAKAVSDGAILGVMNQDWEFEAIGDSLSTTEMYYDVSEYVVEYDTGKYMLALNNSGSGILSVSELKLNKAITAASSAEVGTVIEDALEENNTEAAFVPERFEVSYNDTVKSGRTTSISVKTSLPVENDPAQTVDSVELLDEDGNLVKEFKFSNKAAVNRGKASYCSYTVSVKVTEDVTYQAVAYNENGEASAPLEITISVQ